MLRRDVRPEVEADNRVVAEGEDGYYHGTAGLPVGLHWVRPGGFSHLRGALLPSNGELEFGGKC
jgi:hypothetical protein